MCHLIPATSIEDLNSPGLFAVNGLEFALSKAGRICCGCGESTRYSCRSLHRRDDEFGPAPWSGVALRGDDSGAVMRILEDEFLVRVASMEYTAVYFVKSAGSLEKVIARSRCLPSTDRSR